MTTNQTPPQGGNGADASGPVTPEFLARFMTYRKRLFAAICIALAEDGHHKSYEGTVGLIFPHYFHNEDDFIITVDCYVLGPARHYSYSGKTPDECLDKAERDLRKWTGGVVLLSASDSRAGE